MNKHNWVSINRLFTSVKRGRRVYVQALHYPIFANLSKEKGHAAVTFMKEAFFLSADAHAGQSVNTGGNIRRKKLKDGTNIEYFIYNGNVLIKQIQFSRGSTLASAAGLYKVEYDPRIKKWQTKQGAVGAIDLSHKWKASVNNQSHGASLVNAHFAAYAGKYASSTDAGELLADHLRGAYGEKERQFNPKSMDAEENHYSLLWLNPGEHTSKLGASMIAENIKQCAQKDARVHTLVQGEAAETFLMAAQRVQQHASDAKLSDGLKKQQFYFSNPKNASEQQLKKACQSMGVTYVGLNSNPRDLRQLGRNAVSEIYNIELNAQSVFKAFRATAAASHTVATHAGKAVKGAATLGAGAVAMSGGFELMKDASGFASLVENVELFNKIQPIMTNKLGQAALVGLGAFVVGGWAVKQFKAGSSLARTIRATGKSTFGDGNQFWYDDDKAFLARQA